MQLQPLRLKLNKSERILFVSKDDTKCPFLKVVSTDEWHAPLDRSDGIGRGWITHRFETNLMLQRQKDSCGVMLLY